MPFAVRSADAVEQILAVEHRLHSKLRQELTVEGASQIEPADCKYDVRLPFIPIMIVSPSLYVPSESI